MIMETNETEFRKFLFSLTEFRKFLVSLTDGSLRYVHLLVVEELDKRGLKQIGTVIASPVQDEE